MAKQMEVVRFWQLPSNFFSLELSEQWQALEAVTSQAVPLSKPRSPCPLSLRDDLLASCFFLITLTLPIGIALMCFVFMILGWWWHLSLLFLISLMLALHPIPRYSIQGRSNEVVIAICKYFTFEILVDRNDPFQDGFFRMLATQEVNKESFQLKHLPAIYLACPHGVFNYGAIIWCCISRWFTGWYQVTGAAMAVTKVPGLRYMDLPIWIVNPTRKNIKKEMQKANPKLRRNSEVAAEGQRTGGMLGMVPDGILGAFRSRPGVDELVIGKKRGLMRIAAEEGVTVYAAWFFGTNELLTVVQDPFQIMENLSRKLKTGIMGFYGRWGLPVPRRIPLTLIVAPTKVSKIENPTPEQVDAVHEEVYIKGLQRVYEEQKSYAGYPDRCLVIK